MAMRAKNKAFLLPMRVWDGATRLFHWALPVLLLVSYFSVTYADGPNAALLMRIHVISGETMLGFLLFRLFWGLIGSETARFAGTLKSPFAALHHLGRLFRREADTEVGHNAAGGWMVLVILLVLSVQVGSGLFANDDGDTEGPLAHFVSKATSDQLSKLHDINFNVVLGVVGVHLLAVFVYAVFKRQNLVRPMITGKKRLPATTRAPRMAGPWLTAATVAVAAGIAVTISRL
jgi:cytochrome b